MHLCRNRTYHRKKGAAERAAGAVEAEKKSAKEPAPTYRILFLEEGLVHYIRSDGLPGSEWPDCWPVDDLVINDLAPVSDNWAGTRAIDDNELTEFQREKRDKAFAVVTALRELAEADGKSQGMAGDLLLLRRRDRIRLTKLAAQKLHIPANVIARFLQRWWVRGMVKNACLPDLARMSGKGVPRPLDDTAVDMTGAPLDPKKHPSIGRRFGSGKRENRKAPSRGCRMTNWMRNDILTRGVPIYLGNKNYSVPSAYTKWKEGYRLQRCPSEKSFYTVLSSVPAVREELSQRRLCGRKSSGKPANRSNTRSRIPGPGFCYQLDASPLPIRLLNPTTGEVGPLATLYFVVDPHVTGIAGIYVSPKAECAQGYFAAFLNATLPKGPFCAANGVPLEDPNEWPMEIVPEHFVADRGPLMGPVANRLIEVFDVNLSNAPAYSPQLKSAVESTFGVLLRKVFTQLDDYVPPRPNRKLDGGTFPPMTIAEINVLTILFVLEFNSNPSGRLPTPLEHMANAEMSATGLWNALSDKLRGNGKELTEAEKLLALTQRVKADIDRSGIALERIRFQCLSPNVVSLLNQLGEKSRKIWVYYDEGTTNQIFVQVRELYRLGVNGPIERTGDAKKDDQDPAYLEEHEFIRCPLHQDSIDDGWLNQTFFYVREVWESSLGRVDAAQEKHEKRRTKTLHAMSELPGNRKPEETAKSVVEVGNDIRTAEADRAIAQATKPKELAAAPAKNFTAREPEVISAKAMAALVRRTPRHTPPTPAAAA